MELPSVPVSDGKFVLESPLEALPPLGAFTGISPPSSLLLSVHADKTDSISTATNAIEIIFLI
jgi:hypothetical protein